MRRPIGSSHMPKLHLLVSQSSFFKQNLPFSHLFGQVPPQSASTSCPFLTLSSQDASWHTFCALQKLLMQSSFLTQEISFSHFLQGPLQSTALSPWFLILSSQVGWAQTPKLQKSVIQSPSVVQVAPAEQVAPQIPPQSIPSSFPFCVPSLQLGGRLTAMRADPFALFPT